MHSISINNLVVGLKSLNLNKNLKKYTEFVKSGKNLKKFSRLLYPLLQKEFNLVKQKFLGKTSKKIFTIINSLKLVNFSKEKKNGDNLIEIISTKKINFLKKENTSIFRRIFKYKNRNLMVIKEKNKNFVKKKINTNRFQRFDRLIEYISPEWEQEKDNLKKSTLSKILTNEVYLM